MVKLSFVAWPLELGLGTCNPHFVAWPLELGLGTLNPRFVDKKLIEELDTKTTDVLRNMCKHNPPSAQPSYKGKKADLIYKRVFCDFI